MDTPDLSAAEALFLMRIVICPGSKLNGGEAYSDDDEPLWPRLEQLDLITAVGSYKWKPTQKLLSMPCTALAAALDPAA